ncbi:hypothetical protein, partial [Escherichia coli]|uniref:hypothetical protein n=1 Tax=Escherichia coli TaxID=562 RepID=UPI001D077DB6
QSLTGAFEKPPAMPEDIYYPFSTPLPHCAFYFASLLQKINQSQINALCLFNGDLRWQGSMGL